MYTIEEKRKYQREWMAKRRKKYISKMGACFFCGTYENIEIHHIDPETKKDHKIWSWSEKRILHELKSCVAMCKSCHSKFHGILKRKPFRHGELHCYDKGACRCELCKEAKARSRKPKAFYRG